MKTPTVESEECIEACNSLLRGEISAVETYAKAIAKYRGEPQIAVLEAIRDEHVENANRLRHNIKLMGGEPDRDSGAWGNFAKAVQAAANLFGEDSAQRALLEGEQHGREEYQKALKNNQVLPDCKEMILNELLPRTEHHIFKLKSMTKCL